MFRASSLRRNPDLGQAAPHWSRIGERASEPALPFRSNERHFCEDLERPFDVESIVARGHAKVLAHYHQLLRSPGLAPEERADIEARIAREENYWIENHS